jgi:hypothetical protein
MSVADQSLIAQNAHRNGVIYYEKQRFSPLKRIRNQTTQKELLGKIEKDELKSTLTKTQQT